jgi:hypothetical protein
LQHGLEYEDANGCNPKNHRESPGAEITESEPVHHTRDASWKFTGGRDLPCSYRCDQANQEDSEQIKEVQKDLRQSSQDQTPPLRVREQAQRASNSVNVPGRGEVLNTLATVVSEWFARIHPGGFGGWLNMSHE